MMRRFLCLSTSLLLAVFLEGLTVSQNLVKLSMDHYNLIVRANVDYRDVTLRINPEGGIFSKKAFDYKIKQLPAGETKIPLSGFAKPDGLRFNPDTYAVREVWFTTEGGTLEMFEFKK